MTELLASLIALIGSAFNVLLHVYERAPMQAWAIAACWLGGIAITQHAKTLLPDDWSCRGKQLTTFAIGFALGALLPWLLWPPAPPRQQIAVAILGGLGATTSYAATVRLIGLAFPAWRVRMSANKRSKPSV